MDKQRIKRLLEEHEQNVLLEIGANDGSDTIEFIRHLPDAQIYAFEPDPRAIEKFKRHILGVGGCTLVEAAVCDADGTIPFHASGGTWLDREDQDGQWDKSGSIKQPTGHRELHPWCTFEKVINVPAVKLDTWIQMQDIEEVGFVWADVQGAELEMIRGGKEMFAGQVHYLYTEYSNTELYEGQPTLAQIIEALPGYRVVEDFGGDVLLANGRFA